MQERRNAASAAFAKAADEMVAPANERRLQWIGAAMHRTGFPEAAIVRALTRGGTVVAWGSNYGGKTTVPAGLRGVVAIAAGGNHTVALKLE